MQSRPFGRQNGNGTSVFQKIAVVAEAAAAGCGGAVRIAEAVFGSHSVRFTAASGGSRAVSRAGREAFGMAGSSGFADRNSPEATGGGSLGYNRNLLEY